MAALLFYDFLALSLLFLAPGALVWALRPDLRPFLWRAAACAMPFAPTERLFYPTYWSPRFLFNLVDVVGFGVEDLLFLAGLASFTTAAYPFAFRRALVPLGPAPSRRAFVSRASSLIGLALFAALGLVALGAPALYASVAATAAAALVALVRRPDLVAPSLLGGLVSTLVYAALCLAYEALLPGVFRRVWHTERLIGRFLLGVPLEELLYGWAAGSAAGAFLPYALGLGFARLAPGGGAPRLSRR